MSDSHFPKMQFTFLFSQWVLISYGIHRQQFLPSR